MSCIESMPSEFNAMEYQVDGSFQSKSYRFAGSEQTGWKIFRDRELVLQLPVGYRQLKTVACGICSTDLARAQLPFPLPQITGHEVLAMDCNNLVAVEINASHFARGEKTECYYCNHGLDHHCPERLTLGIDRLPGGFSPYILAPKNSIVPIPKEIDNELAVLIEPLAAAIRAVETTPIDKYKSVAVVGPRKLGCLLLLVLDSYRKKQGLKFSLSAIIRNSENEALCRAAGADEVFYSANISNKNFDVVFDTSGSLSGFELSLSIAKKILHLKSTNGMTYQGLDVLTEMVIDEISLHPLSSGVLAKLNSGSNQILVDQQLVEQGIIDLIKYKIFSTASEKNPRAENATGRFDVAIISEINTLNYLLKSNVGKSVLMPEANVYVCSINNLKSQDTLSKAINETKIQLLTSRCGKFNKAIEFMRQEKQTLAKFKSIFITHVLAVGDLNKAFILARSDPSCVKAVVRF